MKTKIILFFLACLLAATAFGGGFSGGPTNGIVGGVAGDIPWQIAPSLTGFIAPGTTGQFLLSNGSAVPTWATPSALLVGRGTNIAGGSAGVIPWQSAPSVTNFTSAGTSGQVLESGGTLSPTWHAQSTLNVGQATNLNGGAQYKIPMQSSAGSTTFIAAPGAIQFLQSDGSGVPGWGALPSPAVSAWTDVTAVRSFGVGYSGGVEVEIVTNAAGQCTFNTGVVAISFIQNTFFIHVPAGSTYALNNTAGCTIVNWYERAD